MHRIVDPRIPPYSSKHSVQTGGKHPVFTLLQQSPTNTGGGPWCLAEEEERERERESGDDKNSDEYYILNKLGILAY